MFNKVVLVGNLTRDIELRYLQSGTAIGKAGIAVTRKYSGANGERKEETCFIDIDFFGRTAEVANQYLHKGSKVLIEGRLKFDQWQDANGQNRSKHSISVENMEMLNSPSQQGGNYQNNPNSNYGANSSNNYNGGNSYGNSSYNQNGYSNSNGYNQNSYNSYGNQNSQNSYGSYGNANSQSQKPNENYAKPKEQDYSENIPEVDVDADKYDGDETIPF